MARSAARRGAARKRVRCERLGGSGTRCDGGSRRRMAARWRVSRSRSAIGRADRKAGGASLCHRLRPKGAWRACAAWCERAQSTPCLPRLLVRCGAPWLCRPGPAFGRQHVARVLCALPSRNRHGRPGNAVGCRDGCRVRGAAQVGRRSGAERRGRRAARCGIGSAGSGDQRRHAAGGRADCRLGQVAPPGRGRTAALLASPRAPRRPAASGEDHATGWTQGAGARGQLSGDSCSAGSGPGHGAWTGPRDHRRHRGCGCAADGVGTRLAGRG